MAALSTIRSRVKNLVASNTMITDAVVDAIIQADHATILEDYSWTRRKVDTLVDVVGTYTTGTVTTSGATVTGSGTTFTSGMVGRFIRIGTRTFFHEITAFGSTTSLTIEQALPENVTTATTYTIFRHKYALPSTFGRVLNLTGNVRCSEWPRRDIDRLDPYRSSTSADPDIYTVHGLDSIPSGVFEIEFWPVPSAARAYRLEFLRTNTITAETDEPLYRSDVLIWKAAESVAFFLHGKTGDAAWLALADRYHGRYLEALQGAKEDDFGRTSPVSYVRDRLAEDTRGDDFYLDHDPLRLR